MYLYDFQCTNLNLADVRPKTAPFVSAEHVESRIDEQIKLSWMTLHKYFKERSSDNSTVPTEVFQREYIVGFKKIGHRNVNTGSKLLLKPL